jgi:spore maturation protein SpmA
MIVVGSTLADRENVVDLQSALLARFASRFFPSLSPAHVGLADIVLARM